MNTDLTSHSVTAQHINTLHTNQTWAGTFPFTWSSHPTLQSQLINSPSITSHHITSYLFTHSHTHTHTHTQTHCSLESAGRLSTWDDRTRTSVFMHSCMLFPNTCCFNLMWYERIPLSVLTDRPNRPNPPNPPFPQTNQQIIHFRFVTVKVLRACLLLPPTPLPACLLTASPPCPSASPPHRVPLRTRWPPAAPPSG